MFPRTHKHFTLPEPKHRCPLPKRGRKKSGCLKVQRKHGGVDPSGKALHFWFANCCYSYAQNKRLMYDTAKRSSFNKNLTKAKNNPDRLMRIAHRIILETEKHLNKAEAEQKIPTKELVKAKQRLRDSKAHYMAFYDDLQNKRFKSTAKAKAALIRSFMFVLVFTEYVKGEIVRLMGYPKRVGKPSKRCQPGEGDLTCFNRLIAGVFKRNYPNSMLESVDISKPLCRCQNCKTSKNNGKPAVLTLHPSQNFVRTMIHPDSPYKGLLLWHSVGAGKTLAALKAMEQFALAYRDYNFYWVTKPDLVGDLEKEHGNLADTLVERLKEYTYRQFGGAVTGNSSRDLEGRYPRYASAALREARERDPLFRSVVVIDEAHLCFDYNHETMTSWQAFPQGPPNKRWTMQSVMDAFHRSHAISGEDSVRILLLTATPVDYDPNVFLQLLNLITEKPLLQYDTTFSALKSNLKVITRKEGGAKKDSINWQKRKPLGATQWHVIESTAFQNAVRGLISFNVLEEDMRRFARKEPITHEVLTNAMILQRLKQCMAMKSNTAQAKCIRNAGSTGLRSAAGNKEQGYNPLNVKKPRAGIKDRKKQRTTLCKQSPKLLELLENIEHLDNADKAKYGRTFKHMIYSRLERGFGAPFIAGGLKHYLGMTMLYPMRSASKKLGKGAAFELKADGERRPGGNFAVLTSTPLIPGQPRLTAPQRTLLKNYIKNIFNARPPCKGNGKDNSRGQHIRIIVLDSGFKEGIDIKDVRYVHMYEPQLTEAATIQATGRAFRYCGQSCLDYKTGQNGEYGWVVKVFTYATTLPDLGIQAQSTLYSNGISVANYATVCSSCQKRGCTLAKIKVEAKRLGLRLSVKGKAKNKATLCTEVHVKRTGQPLPTIKLPSTPSTSEEPTVVLDKTQTPTSTSTCKRYTLSELRALEDYKTLPPPKPRKKVDVCDALVNRKAHEQKHTATQKAKERAVLTTLLKKDQLGTQRLADAEKRILGKKEGELRRIKAVMQTYRADAFLDLLQVLEKAMVQKGIEKKKPITRTGSPCSSTDGKKIRASCVRAQRDHMNAFLEELDAVANPTKVKYIVPSRVITVLAKHQPHFLHAQGGCILYDSILQKRYPKAYAAVQTFITHPGSQAKLKRLQGLYKQACILPNKMCDVLVGTFCCASSL